MNVLDENVPADEREALRRHRVAIRQVGFDLGWKGLKDENIIPFLLRLRRTTFFTLDGDFDNRKLRHGRYCLVYLAVPAVQAAADIRRVLRHPAFNTQAKRMGAVIRATETGITVWRLHAEAEEHLSWPR